MAALDMAGPGDVSFLGNDKYHGQFQQTRAGAVLVPRGETGGPQTTALIAVENPTLAFGTVVRHFIAISRTFTPGIHPDAHVDPGARLDPANVRIHAGAVIMEGASIGDGSEIGSNCSIGAGVVIGRDCHIMSNVSIREHCVLGNRVFIQPGAVIGSDGFGYQFSEGRHVKIDQVGIVEIGNDVEIGANTTIDRARFGKTLVGEGTKIDNLVQIGHNCVIGRHCLIVSLTGISGSTQVGDYVTFAGQTGTVGHIKICDKVTLAGRSGVTTDISEPGLYGGNPAIPLNENLKLRAHARRLPKLIEKIKALEDAVARLTPPA